jgi:hypothetical protein
MAEDGEGHDEVIMAAPSSQGDGGIECKEGVVPDVAFGMPGGILRAVDEGLQFRVVVDPAAVSEETQTEGRAHTLEEKLFPFPSNPLDRKMFTAEGTAERECLGGSLQLKAGDELHTSQDAQGVLRKLRRNVAQRATFQILKAIPRIDQLLRQWIVGNGIEGEITARSCFAETHRRVHFDFEILMPWSCWALFAGEGEVDLMGMVMPDWKGFSDVVKTLIHAKKVAGCLLIEAEELKVEISARQAEKRIANCAADDEESPTFLGGRLCQPTGDSKSL